MCDVFLNQLKGDLNSLGSVVVYIWTADKVT